MPMYVFASAKGSPGVTTLVTGVAARWPGESRPLLIEADPHGGDLAARFQLRPAPGLVSAAADRHLAAGGDGLDVHAQPLPLARIATLLAPAQFAPAAAAVRAISDGTLLRAAAADRPLLVDVGALTDTSPALALAVTADLVVLGSGDRTDDLAHTHATADLLAAAGAQVALVIRRGRGLTNATISRELGLPVLADFPADALGAGILSGRLVAARVWWRLRLPRAAAGIAAILADRSTDPDIDAARLEPAA